MNKSINRSINSGAPRAKRASGAPWVNKSTHPRKFGNYVTERPSDRPSVRTTGIPMFTLTLSSYFGSPGESWLHINVVVNWQLSKQGIRWPYRGLRCRPIKVEYFLKLSADNLLVFKWSQAHIYFFLKFIWAPVHIKYVVFMSVSPRTITILISNWPQTQKFGHFFLKYRRGRPFLTIVSRL